MTPSLQQTIDTLNAIVTFNADESMPDADFIANVEAINLLCNLYDDLGLDPNGIRRRIDCLYPELLRRIDSKENKQLAMPLIKALHRFIYGRNGDLGHAKWRVALNGICRKVVEEYLTNPLIDPCDYLFALDVVCREEESRRNPPECNSAEPFSTETTSMLPDSITEYRETLSALLEGIDNASLPERIRRVRAYERARHLFTPDNWEEWAFAREALIKEDLSPLDDNTLILWWEITDEPPMKELRKRAANSNQMNVEYLQASVYKEFARHHRLMLRRKLAAGMKSLNDEIIGDILPIKIDAEMSVSTLFALETIFSLRLQLAQISDDDKMSVYESLCLDRCGKIANALKKKYPTAESLNEKIEILERLSIIGAMTHSYHYDFAIEEAANLKSPALVGRDEEGLTYAQRLRLDWIPNINSENDSEIVERILNAPSLAGRDGERLTAFDMETLALISDCVTPSEREAIFNRFTELTNAAIASNDIKALSKLLVLAPYWISYPTLRQRIKELTRQTQFLIPNSSFLIEFRVNAIAADIYSRIDAITATYDPHTIPA